MGREPLLYVAIGRKGIGKTVTTMQKLRKYVAGDPANGVAPRRVLIFDANNEYSDKEKYPDIKSMDLGNVYKFSMHPKIEIRRIPPFLPNGNEMTPDQKASAVLYILQYYRNGLLLLEDINNYIGDYLPSDVVGTILSQRHKGIDMVLHYHSLGRIQKKIWPHINVLRMHKCSDWVVRNKDKFEDKFECFSIAEIIVNKQFAAGNIYFNLEIDANREKIYANITDEERDLCIQEYIGSAHSSLITPLLNMKNINGGKVHTYVSAFNQQKERVLNTYFDID